MSKKLRQLLALNLILFIMVGNDNKTSNFYSVSNGKIVKSFGGIEPKDVKTESRVNKNGNTVFEQKFSFLEAFLTRASLKTSEDYGDSICLDFTDGSENAQLQIKFDSAYGRSFLYKIKNADFSQKVKISPYSFVDKTSGKNVLGLQMFNGSSKIANYYTKDNLNGLPPMVEVTFKGKKTWDNTEQIAFLKNLFLDFCSKICGQKVTSIDIVQDVEDVEDSSF